MSGFPAGGEPFGDDGDDNRSSGSRSTAGGGGFSHSGKAPAEGEVGNESAEGSEEGNESVEGSEEGNESAEGSEEGNESDVGTEKSNVSERTSFPLPGLEVFTPEQVRELVRLRLAERSRQVTWSSGFQEYIDHSKDLPWHGGKGTRSGHVHQPLTRAGNVNQKFRGTPTALLKGDGTVNPTSKGTPAPELKLDGTVNPKWKGTPAPELKLDGTASLSFAGIPRGKHKVDGSVSRTSKGTPLPELKLDGTINPRAAHSRGINYVAYHQSAKIVYEFTGGEQTMVDLAKTLTKLGGKNVDAANLGQVLSGKYASVGGWTVSVVVPPPYKLPHCERLG